jgi:lipopolysaccharide export LptBFGC system permease protein LptF
MENRTALRGAGISKGLVVLFAVIVAIGLGVMAAFVAKSVSGPAAATQSDLVQSTYSGPGPDAQERNNHASPLQYADDKPSTGHGFLP